MRGKGCAREVLRVEPTGEALAGPVVGPVGRAGVRRRFGRVGRLSCASLVGVFGAAVWILGSGTSAYAVSGALNSDPLPCIITTTCGDTTWFADHGAGAGNASTVCNEVVQGAASPAVSGVTMYYSCTSEQPVSMLSDFETQFTGFCPSILNGGSPINGCYTPIPGSNDVMRTSGTDSTCHVAPNQAGGSKSLLGRLG